LSFIVLELDFDLADLAALRFAISPMAEAVSALGVYGSAGGAGAHRPWLSDLGDVRRDAAFDLLHDLVPHEGYSPDFLTPPVSVPVGAFDAELAAVRATPAAVVRSELERTFAGRAMPRRVLALHADPATRLSEVAVALARWYAIAIEPYWERLHAMLAAEVARQSRRLSEEGPGLTLGKLHPSVRWQQGRLAVDMRWEARIQLDGRGLLLVPSAFWQGVGPIVLGSGQPTLLYPAAGVS
jgi:hypothetical protein